MNWPTFCGEGKPEEGWRRRPLACSRFVWLWLSKCAERALKSLPLNIGNNVDHGIVNVCVHACFSRGTGLGWSGSCADCWRSVYTRGRTVAAMLWTSVAASRCSTARWDMHDGLVQSEPMPFAPDAARRRRSCVSCSPFGMWVSCSTPVSDSRARARFGNTSSSITHAVSRCFSSSCTSTWRLCSVSACWRTGAATCKGRDGFCGAWLPLCRCSSSFKSPASPRSSRMPRCTVNSGVHTAWSCSRQTRATLSKRAPSTTLSGLRVNHVQRTASGAHSNPLCRFKSLAYVVGLTYIALTLLASTYICLLARSFLRHLEDEPGGAGLAAADSLQAPESNSVS